MRVLHCWKDQGEHIVETYGFHSDEHLATYREDFKGGTCMLPANHPEPHDFTPDDQIGVTFAKPN